jgi:hypothetical protein
MGSIPKTQQNANITSIEENGGSDLLDAGLRATARGWKIFPCNYRKEPLVKWSEAATTDEGTIRAWAKQWPGALWARALPADILLIDLDLKHGNNGIREFARLQGCKPEHFDAPRVVTGTGGMHIYTDAAGRDFKNTSNAIAPGIDTRTGGGYCIIPSGDGYYRWLTDPDIPLPEAPAWTDAALRKEHQEPLAEARPFHGFSPYGSMLLEYAIEAIESAPGGTQEITLGSRSLIIGHYIAGGILDYKPTINKLVAAGLRMVNTEPRNPWTEKQVRQKVIRAVAKGMEQPMDGEEVFRAYAEAMKEYDENPQLHDAVMELLADAEPQAEEEPKQGQRHGKAVEAPKLQAEHPKHGEPTRQPPPSVGAGDKDWPVLNPDAMYGLAGDVVRAIAPHTESDPVALLVQVIAYSGNAMGRYSFYQVESDCHYPNLFAVLVGQSSKSRKGTAAGRIRDIMEMADHEWAEKCVSSGLSSGEGVIWRIRDPIYKMKKGQRVLEDPGVEDHRLLLDEREFYQALTVMKREGNTLSRVIRDAWDRGTLQTITKNSPACASDAHVSIVGHITEDELRQNLDHTSMMNGVANRFVFALVRRAKLLPHGGSELVDAMKAPLGWRLKSAIEEASGLTLTFASRV